MKISDACNHKKSLSFEIFPPKKDSELKNIDATLDVLCELQPDFISVAAQNFCHNFSLFLTQIFGKYFRNLIHETEGFLPSVFLTFKMIITLLFNVGYNDLFFDFYLFLRKGCNLFLKLIDSVTYLLTLFA